MGGLIQKRSHAYRVGGLVKNVMSLSIRTIWMLRIKRKENITQYSLNFCCNMKYTHCSQEEKDPPYLEKERFWPSND